MSNIRVDWPEKKPPGIQKFVKALKKLDPAYSSVTFERRLFLRKHCGERMYKVVASDKAVSALVNFKVCGVCGHHKQGWFDGSRGVGI